jgi:hypothetical protein
MQIDIIWTLVGFVLTLMIFSFVFGDNVFFRLASYLFIGVTAGYVAVLIIYQVILPKLLWPLLSALPSERLLTIIPLALSVLLLLKFSPKLSGLGSLSMAYLVGVGAALAIGGAVLGTIINQAGAVINAFDIRNAPGNPAVSILEAALLLFGVVTTLAYFNFGAKSKPNQPPQRSKFVSLMAKFGEIFIAITLGAVFAGVYGAALSALIDRLDFIMSVINALI